MIICDCLFSHVHYRCNHVWIEFPRVEHEIMWLLNMYISHYFSQSIGYSHRYNNIFLCDNEMMSHVNCTFPHVIGCFHVRLKMSSQQIYIFICERHTFIQSLPCFTCGLTFPPQETTSDIVQRGWYSHQPHCHIIIYKCKYLLRQAASWESKCRELTSCTSPLKTVR